MDIRKVRTLIEIAKKSGIAEIEVTEGEEAVRISFNHHTANTTFQPATANPAITPSLTLPTNSPPSQAAEMNTIAGDKIVGHTVNSPMVGTLYISPAPGEPPFVEVGQSVQLGDTLCIVEAMKMFNPIEADKAGTVSARLVDNGQPVEFGQPLFIIE